MSVPWSSKKECRSFFKSLCLQEMTQSLVQNQQQLDSQLRDFFKSRHGIWGAYRALSLEAQVEEVFRLQQVSWVFPKMKEDHLEFFNALTFAQGPYGVLEPASDSTLLDLSKIQGLLIPGLAFNKNGNRLGKGKGFYDKTLETYQGLKVGVCFDFQITEHPLPIEAHDVKMDFIITESGWIDCKK